MFWRNSRIGVAPDDRGDGLDDPIEVLVGQAVLEDEAVVVLLLRRVDVVERLDARTMTLVAPRSAICRWASALAPSAIASMAMTDETPKISPRIVSRTRSLCSVRLRSARAMVFDEALHVRARFHVTAGASSLVLLAAFRRRASLRVLVLELGRGAGAGVEGDGLAFLEALEDLDELSRCSRRP